MRDNYPYWPPSSVQDFHLIPGGQIASGIRMINIDSLIPEYRDTEVTTTGKPSVYHQKPDSKGFNPVFGNVSSDLFARLNASLNQNPADQVGNPGPREI